jgi:hypothetical protein
MRHNHHLETAVVAQSKSHSMKNADNSCALKPKERQGEILQTERLSPRSKMRRCYPSPGWLLLVTLIGGINHRYRNSCRDRQFKLQCYAKP